MLCYKRQPIGAEHGDADPPTALRDDRTSALVSPIMTDDECLETSEWTPACWEWQVPDLSHLHDIDEVDVSSVEGPERMTDPRAQ